jgi:uncharacterized membrane protein
MFNVTSVPGRIARALGLLALVAALFSGLALTTTPASARAGLGTLGVHAIAANGAGIQRAVVRLYDRAGTNVAKVETDAGGNAAFKVAAGTYKIGITAQGFESATTGAPVVAGVVTNVSVTMQSNAAPVVAASGAPGSGAVVAQVNSTSGANVPQAAIYLFTAKGEVAAKGETDASGTATLVAPAGNYTVLVKAAGYKGYQPTGLLAVESGQKTALAVTLQPSITPDRQ